MLIVTVSRFEPACLRASEEGGRVPRAPWQPRSLRLRPRLVLRTEHTEAARQCPSCPIIIIGIP
eukprot:2841084-Rhodomonas_salina.1